MSKLLEKISILVGIITGIPLILGWIGWVTGFFRNQNLEWQILFIAVILLCILLMGAYQIWTLRNIVPWFANFFRQFLKFTPPICMGFQTANHHIWEDLDC